MFVTNFVSLLPWFTFQSTTSQRLPGKSQNFYNQKGQSEGNSIGRQGNQVERLLVGIFIYLFTSKVDKNRN